MDKQTQREVKLMQLEKLMRENPDRVNRGENGEVATGRTLRPLPTHSLTPEAQKALVEKMRSRSPSKITRRQMEVSV